MSLGFGIIGCGMISHFHARVIADVRGAKLAACYWDFAKPSRHDPAILHAMTQRKSTGGGAADPKAIGHHGHARLFQDVLTAIRKGTKPLIDGREGRRSVEIILAIYKAAETGRAIELPLKADPVLKARKIGGKR